MLTVGLTGGFGTGKSTVAKLFAKLGAKTIDADQINHELIHRGGKCFQKIIRLFGKNILTKGDINRKKIAAIVFNDKNKLQKLNAIVHPVIVGEIKKKIAGYKKNKDSIIIIDAPLLIEVGLHRLCDILIVVKASRQQQLKRIMRRMHIKRSETAKRIKAQMALQDKIRLADIIIDNNGKLTKTQREVNTIWQELSKKKKKTVR